MTQNETSKIADLIDHLSGLIKMGQTKEASQKLLELGTLKLNRTHRLPLAQICRRVGLYNKGMKILTPVVRPQSSLQEPAKAEELSEYAVMLSRVGCLKEAREILCSLDSEAHPQALLYLGYSHISDWNYGKALPFIRAYQKAPIEPYPLLVAKVNELACLIAIENFSEALELFETLIEKAGSLQATRLKGNIYELGAQAFIGTGNFSRASTHLNKAQKLLSQSASYDDLLIKKWKAWIEANKMGDATPLMAVRKEAIAISHWETIRDLDFLELKLKFNKTNFQQLIAGSASSSYKNKVMETFKATPEDYTTIGNPNAPVLDLARGTLGEVGFLKPSSSLLSLLRCLSEDNYFPIQVGAIHSSLFPDEFYNVFSSPLKIRQLIFRLRRSLAKSKAPLEIINTKESYRISICGNLQLRLSTMGSYHSSDEDKLLQLKSQFENGFTTQQAIKALGASASSIHRKLRQWKAEDLIYTEGTGRSTRYYFNNIEKVA